MSKSPVLSKEEVNSINCAEAIWTLFLTEFFKVYDKMDLPIQMRIIVTKERTQNIVTPFVWNL